MKKTLSYVVFYLLCLGAVAAFSGKGLLAHWFAGDQRVLIAQPN